MEDRTIDWDSIKMNTGLQVYGSDSGPCQMAGFVVLNLSILPPHSGNLLERQKSAYSECKTFLQLYQ
jgi:hypothetical protein